MRINKLKFQFALGRAGLTQAELAEKIHMSRGNLSTIINGKSCQPKTMFKIADGLGVDVTELLED